MNRLIVKHVLSRDGKEIGTPTGGQSRCQMEGCFGLRITVRWPDGKLSRPCSKGMRASRNDTWRIQ